MSMFSVQFKQNGCFYGAMKYSTLTQAEAALPNMVGPNEEWRIVNTATGGTVLSGIGSPVQPTPEPTVEPAQPVEPSVSRETRQKNSKKVDLLNIPNPIVGDTLPTDQYDLAALFAVNGLERFSGYIDAATQKAIIGHNVFGKKRVYIDCTGQGSVTVSVKVCFGTDWNQSTYSFLDVLTAAQERRKLEA